MTPLPAFSLRTISPADVPQRRDDAVDPQALRDAATIVEDVRARGEAAVRAHAERLGDLSPGQPLIIDGAALRRACERLPADQQALLRRVAGRIGAFAEAQRGAISELRFPIPGGIASHRIAPIARAGCYAPGGRFPLPSSVLMTAVTARVAGVREVIVASPRPAPATLAAAHIAGADALLAAGGAQAVAAMAYGLGTLLPPCDVVVGPGNRWVTAAKYLVSARVGIDMLAGPSELVILADAAADPETVAADLLAQAEHDVDAMAVLVSLDVGLVAQVNEALRRQLLTLASGQTARRALGNGFAVIAESLEQAIELCDRLAPEHLQLVGEAPPAAAGRLSDYGALFVGEQAAEVFGDYGAGPNHVLPTGGTARHRAGLSVLSFLRLQTQLHFSRANGSGGEVVGDAIALARLEGLEAHARAAERRCTPSPGARSGLERSEDAP